MKKKELLEKVENLRGEMHVLIANDKNFSDKELINISKEIDKLLNQYIKGKNN